MTPRDEVPHEIKKLQERHVELTRSADRIEASFTSPPPLRDRNMFFHFLLNGDEVIYERVRPRWKEMRRNRRRAAQVNGELNTAIRRKVQSEPKYRDLVAKVGEEKNVKRSCKRMLESINGARNRIKNAKTSVGTKAARSTVARDARDVSKRLREVRRHADDLQGNFAGGLPFDSHLLARLDIRPYANDDGEQRRERYHEVRASLGVLEKVVRSLLNDVVTRERKAKVEQRQYLKDGQARYSR